MRISDEFLFELTSRCDIQSVVSSYTTLKQRGSNLVGLCPFHNEKTPSFTVYPATSSYYCFGCGSGGDVITFVRKIENLDYIDAVRLLAERAGLQMPENQADESYERFKARLYLANKHAAQFFHKQLMAPQGKKALEYFTDVRKLSINTIRRFGLGYSPDSWDSLYKHMRAEGFDDHELLAAGLVHKRKKGDGCYDVFRNRPIFPIIDVRGNVIGFGGRAMGDEIPKYLNTSDTPIYKKSKEVFALNIAKKNSSEQLILAEGYMDVIALHQAGFGNAVASLGTSLTTEQARLMSRYTKEIVIAYDSDGAGQKATKRALDIFKSISMPVRVLRISGGKDPDEFIKTYGADRFKGILKGAENDIEYRILGAREKADLSTTSGKVSFLMNVAQILASLDSSIERDVYAEKIAEELSVDKNAILSQVTQIARKNMRSHRRELINNEVNKNRQRDTVNPQRRDNIRAASAEEGVIALLMRNPDFYSSVKEKLSADDFVTDFNKKVYAFLTDRIERNESIELTVFSSEFNPDEMGRIVSVMSRESHRANTVDELMRCIEVIKDEKRHKSGETVAKMSDEQLNDYIKSLKQKKK